MEVRATKHFTYSEETNGLNTENDDLDKNIERTAVTTADSDKLRDKVTDKRNIAAVVYSPGLEFPTEFVPSNLLKYIIRQGRRWLRPGQDRTSLDLAGCCCHPLTRISRQAGRNVELAVTALAVPPSTSPSHSAPQKYLLLLTSCT